MTWVIPLSAMRDFMFRYVYIGSTAKLEVIRARHVMESVYRHLVADTNLLPVELTGMIEAEGIQRVVCDYIAGMTDRYIIALYQEIFLPKPWKSG